MPKLLLADDDTTLSLTISTWLKANAICDLVDCVENGEEAWNYIQSFDYELMILDWEMPGMPGIEIVRSVRRQGRMTPILMLTGRISVDDKESGLDSGADDYLTKPFHFKELGARVRALMRRPAQMSSGELRFRHIAMNTATRTVTKSGESIALQPIELSVLEFFLRHPTEVISGEGLLKRLWDSNTDVSLDAIYSCVRRLRRKLDLEGQSSLISNAYGIGYKLNPP